MTTLFEKELLRASNATALTRNAIVGNHIGMNLIRLGVEDTEIQFYMLLEYYIIYGSCPEIRKWVTYYPKLKETGWNS